ncbi:MAG TPA: Hpt domain-containing protein [Fibrobacteraceae bacterium]|nr:Hpt domain-containing protein [Fibrobacteraceae bacterium]
MLVDENVALEELGISKEDYREFLGDLLSFTKEALPKLQTVLPSDKNEVHYLAHSLKGACRNMRFVAAGDLAFSLEKWATGQENGDPVKILDDLKETLRQSFAQFDLLM